MADAEPWNPGQPDKAVAILGAPPFDETMLEKAIPHLGVLWIRADLSPAEVEAVVAHEARHVWQESQVDGVAMQTNEDREADAIRYSLAAPLTSEGQRAARELAHEMTSGK
jgi:phage gp16-like protein